MSAAVATAAPVEDLVRVRVADAAEHARIGEGPLQRAVLETEPRRKFVPGRRQYFEAARSCSASAVSPCTTWSAARFFVLASVSIRVPLLKSNVAKTVFGLTASAFGPYPPSPGTHRNRPEIIRWMTTNRSASSSQTMRLPRRRSANTRRPSRLAMYRRSPIAAGRGWRSAPGPASARRCGDGARAGTARRRGVRATSAFCPSAFGRLPEGRRLPVALPRVQQRQDEREQRAADEREGFPREGQPQNLDPRLRSVLLQLDRL